MDNIDHPCFLLISEKARVFLQFPAIMLILIYLELILLIINYSITEYILYCQLLPPIYSIHLLSIQLLILLKDSSLINLFISLILQLRFVLILLNLTHFHFHPSRNAIPLHLFLFLFPTFQYYLISIPHLIAFQIVYHNYLNFHLLFPIWNQI